MHVQVVAFGLEGVGEEEYHEGCRDETGAFADLPGLITKIWLRSEASNTFGAVYLWRDRESYEEYVKGDIFKSIEDDPSLSNVISRDFDVYEDLTKATQPGLAIV